MSGLQELVGTTIKEIRVQLPQGHYIQFMTTDNNLITYACYGDCCSETWIYAICGSEALLNHLVLSYEEVEMPTPNDDRTRQEYDQLYCYRIRTNNGICDIEFRNSSNGYYGGSLDFCERNEPTECEEYTTSGPKYVPVEFKTITKDFTN